MALALASFKDSIAEPEDHDSLHIVTTLSVVGDWVKEVGGDNIVVTSIVSGLEDVHNYDPDPSEIVTVVESDIFVEIGLGSLEPWVQAVKDSNPSFVEKVVTLLNSSWIEYDPVWKRDNGHIWMSPILVKEMVGTICDALIEADSVHQVSYENNRDSYLNDLDQLLDRIDIAKGILNGTKAIVNHAAFYYYLRLLGINRTGIIENVPGQEPSAQHLEDLVNLIRNDDAEYIITNPQEHYEKVQQLVDDTDITVIFLTPLLGVYGLATYIDMIDFNTNALLDVVSGRPQTFPQGWDAFGILPGVTPTPWIDGLFGILGLTLVLSIGGISLSRRRKRRT